MLAQVIVVSKRCHPSPQNVFTNPDLVLLNVGVGKDVYAPGRNEVLRDWLEAALCKVIIAGVSIDLILSLDGSPSRGESCCFGRTADGDIEVNTRVGLALPGIVHLLRCAGRLLRQEASSATCVVFMLFRKLHFELVSFGPRAARSKSARLGADLLRDRDRICLGDLPKSAVWSTSPLDTQARLCLRRLWCEDPWRLFMLKLVRSESAGRNGGSSRLGFVNGGVRRSPLYGERFPSGKVLVEDSRVNLLGSDKRKQPTVLAPTSRIACGIGLVGRLMASE